LSAGSDSIFLFQVVLIMTQTILCSSPDLNHFARLGNPCFLEDDWKWSSQPRVTVALIGRIHCFSWENMTVRWTSISLMYGISHVARILENKGNLRFVVLMPQIDWFWSVFPELSIWPHFLQIARLWSDWLFWPPQIYNHGIHHCYERGNESAVRITDLSPNLRFEWPAISRLVVINTSIASE
jgi:hypothetical protein